MEELYNVYFAGHVQEGHSTAEVRPRVAALFNASEETLDKLFSGKPQLIKRNCDQATARKYKEALENAGAVPIIKALEETAPPPRPMTAAEKIAALAAEPDKSLQAAPTSVTKPAATAPAGSGDPDNAGGIVLAPAGTEVLRENERAAPVQRDVDTSHLTVDSTAARLSDEPPPPPPAPDTSHLDLAAAGAPLPGLANSAAPVAVNTDNIELCASGTDFSDCSTEPAPPLPLDLSALEIAAEGSELLEERFRKTDAPRIPSTDHLTLDS